MVTRGQTFAKTRAEGIDKTRVWGTLTIDNIPMNTLARYRSPRFSGTFEVNQLYHTVTDSHALFEVRYRHKEVGNGFAPPSETLFTDPVLEKLLSRFREWVPDTQEVPI
jgi:hypothetical protein